MAEVNYKPIPAADLKVAGYQRVEIDSKARHGPDSATSSPSQIKVANTVAADLKVAGYQEVEIDSQARHGADSTPSSPGQIKIANTVAADLKEVGYQEVEIDSQARHGADSTPSSPGQFELANSAQCPIEHQQFVRSVADTLNYDLPPCAKIANESDGTISAVFDVSTTAYDEGESDFRLQVSRNTVYLSSMGLVNVCALPQKSAFFSLFESKQAPICTASMWRVDSVITKDFAKAHDLVVSHEKSKQFFLGRWLSSVVDGAIKKVKNLFSSEQQKDMAQPSTPPVDKVAANQSWKHNAYPWGANAIFNMGKPDSQAERKEKVAQSSSTSVEVIAPAHQKKNSVRSQSAERAQMDPERFNVRNPLRVRSIAEELRKDDLKPFAMPRSLVCGHRMVTGTVSKLVPVRRLKLTWVCRGYDLNGNKRCETGYDFVTEMEFQLEYKNRMEWTCDY